MDQSEYNELIALGEAVQMAQQVEWAQDAYAAALNSYAEFDPEGFQEYAAQLPRIAADDALAPAYGEMPAAAPQAPPGNSDVRMEMAIREAVAESRASRQPA